MAMRKYAIKRKTNDEHDEMNSKSNVNNLGKVQRNFVTNPGKLFKFKRVSFCLWLFMFCV